MTVRTPWEQAIWVYGALEQNIGLSNWMDTPQTAMTTRAPAVLKTSISIWLWQVALKIDEFTTSANEIHLKEQMILILAIRKVSGRSNQTLAQ